MPLDSDALAIAEAGIGAVEPGRAVRTAFRNAAVDRWLGARRASVQVVAVGKGAPAMVRAAAEHLRGRLAGGLAVVPEPVPPLAEGVAVLVGSHPLPTSASFRAGAALLEYVTELAPADRVAFLISGGGSTLAEAPAGGLGLSSVRRTNEALLASGAPIDAVNVVRRHISALKGGRLATATGAGRFLTLAVSDVVGDRPEDIASGPTVPDPTTFADAIVAIDRHRLVDRLPPDVVEHLREGAAGRWPETPKPGAATFRRGRFQLVATNRQAVLGAAREARRRGYRTTALTGHLAGESALAAFAFVERLSKLRGPARRALVAGGETTVALSAHSGKGGRNQQCALAAALALEGRRGTTVLSIGTDGIDGPTDAAGGQVDGDTADRATRLGIHVPTALAQQSAYDALERLDGLVRTGPTGTNVMDLHVGLIGGSGSRKGRRP